MRSRNSHTTNKDKTKRFLIDALRETSSRLSDDTVEYQGVWDNVCGSPHPNPYRHEQFRDCGVYRLQLDEWSEHATDYCSKTGCKVDDIFLTIEQHGMTHEDIVKLENLSDRKVLDNLVGGFRHLERNNRSDVIDYMNSFADLLEKSEV